MIESSILRLISNQPMKRANLLKCLQSEGYELNDRELRKTVEELITKHGHCISSSEAGYHLISSQEEFEKAVAYIEAKSKALNIRRNHLVANFRVQRGVVHNQIEMFI